jgi:RNA polymerase sigma factor (TIGR02999 family)
VGGTQPCGDGCHDDCGQPRGAGPWVQIPADERHNSISLAWVAIGFFNCYDLPTISLVLTKELRKRTGKTVMPGPQKARDEENFPSNSSGPAKEHRSLDDLFSLIYEELRRLASFARHTQGNPTINSTALVHEAWLKLKDSPDLASKSLPHFKSIAAKAMRQVLVDAARRRSARKRGGGGEIQFVTLDKAADQVISCDRELLAVDDSLEQLTRLNPRQAEVIVSRFFGGLSVAETAGLMGVSESVIERDWRTAKAWLASRIRPGKE